MVCRAKEQELLNTGLMYVFYDDFGKLCLKSLRNMFVNVFIDAESCKSYKYYTDMGERTFNKVRLRDRKSTRLNSSH